eukprot:3973389-Pleurochrysis_carterae.AAC.2
MSSEKQNRAAKEGGRGEMREAIKIDWASARICRGGKKSTASSVQPKVFKLVRLHRNMECEAKRQGAADLLPRASWNQQMPAI